MKRTKRVLIEVAGVFFLRAFVVLLLTTIPAYFNQTASETKEIPQVLGDYGTVSGALAVIISVIIVWAFFCGKKFKTFFSEIGSSKFIIKDNLTAYAIVIGVFLCVYLILCLCFGAEIVYADSEVGKLPNALYLFGIIAICVYSDELMFRGFVMTRLEYDKYPLKAILLSCLANILFLSAHFYLYDNSILSWLNAAGMMLLSSVLYARYHSVFLTTGCRVIWTYLSVVLCGVEFYNESREESLFICSETSKYAPTVKSFGLTNSVVVTIVLLISIAILGRFLIRRADSK
ncbi:MAG: CPBP family intramembrane metalloprotease [Parasporobacterium sp.]|nr:CPBP family intramembrane metalloprotease [Parasporobacterium sp.]